MTKVLILGANGFVGKNIASVFHNEGKIALFRTSRAPKSTEVYFDLLQKASWSTIIDINPDFIIDASGYGVVKNQTDLDTLYKVNYLLKREFIDYLFQELPNVFWIQIGTAFEYSLEEEGLTEESGCFPKTHYGISKLLFSAYLKDVLKERFAIIRPFGMFGEGEDISKFFPMLFDAQKNKVKVDLSDGSQYRDYFYVRDLGSFLLDLILNKNIYRADQQVINIGSGRPKTLKELSEVASFHIPNYDPSLWNWGVIPQRLGESKKFYNASDRALQYGFRLTSLENAFQSTIHHYFNL